MLCKIVLFELCRPLLLPKTCTLSLFGHRECQLFICRVLFLLLTSNKSFQIMNEEPPMIVKLRIRNYKLEDTENNLA